MRVHWHLPHVASDARFKLKGPERRGPIRDTVPQMVGLHYNHSPAGGPSG